MTSLPPIDPDASARKQRRRFGVEVVIAALIVGGSAGALAGYLSGQSHDSSGTAPITTASSTVATSSSAPSSTPPRTTGITNTPTIATVPESLQDMIERVTLSVVDLQVEGRYRDFDGELQTGSWVGSGFVIDTDGYIATNAHVIDGADRITVLVHDGTSTTATVVGSNPELDLAVIRVDRTGLPALRLNTSGTLRVGDRVIAAGNALNLAGQPSVTVGIISALGRDIMLGDGVILSGLIQTDAAISSGDSGGPLLSGDGEVIGITTAGASDSIDFAAENIGFAIPMSEAAPELLRLAGIEPAPESG